MAFQARLCLLPAHLLPEGLSEAAVAAGGEGPAGHAADDRWHPVVARAVLPSAPRQVVSQFAAGNVSLAPTALHGVRPVVLLPSAGKHPERDQGGRGKLGIL